jgi:hypothetical protein
VAAPGRLRPLLTCGTASAACPTCSVAVCCGGLPQRRVVAPVGCWPRLAPRPAVSGRIVMGLCRVHPDLAGCLEGGRSSLGVVGPLPPCPAINLQRGCRWGWRRPWLCSGGHGRDVLPHVGCRRGWVLSHLCPAYGDGGALSRSCYGEILGFVVGGHGSGICGGGGSCLLPGSSVCWSSAGMGGCVVNGGALWCVLVP